jgi:dienelactone hydrolase
VHGQAILPPDTISVPSGNLILKGLLWHPVGTGAFPSIIFCHGSYESNDLRYDAIQQISVLGPLFAKNGYIFFGFFREGTGLSEGQGESSADLMSKAFKEKGQQERDKIQVQRLQTNDLQDMFSGLTFLRHQKNVDTNHIAVVGHSFGGSLALLVAEHDVRIKAVAVFGAAGHSWDLSSQLRTTLIEAVKKINAPTMMAYAQNDYSLSPAHSLDSVMNLYGKPHILKIYPRYGKSSAEGHNIIFLNTNVWKDDILKFLDKYLRQ